MGRRTSSSRIWGASIRRASQLRASARQAAMGVGGEAERGMPASIVVLPFVDLSPEQDQEYFCHGITEEIINSLATSSAGCA